MPNKINIQVNAFTTVENIVRKINEVIAGNNVAGVFYNKTSLLQGDIEIVLDKNTNIVEVPVRHAKGAGTSQYRGVYWVKKEGKWRVQLSHKGKRYTVGRFTDEIEAAKAYDKKVFELLGQDAYLNFPLYQLNKTNVVNECVLKVGDKVKVIDYSIGSMVGVRHFKYFKINNLDITGNYKVEIENNGWLGYTDISNLKKVCD